LIFILVQRHVTFNFASHEASTGNPVFYTVLPSCHIINHPPHYSRQPRLHYIDNSHLSASFTAVFQWRQRSSLADVIRSLISRPIFVTHLFHPSGVGKSSTSLHWLGLRRGVFVCVGWQVTLCDPIWQATPSSSEMDFH